MARHLDLAKPIVPFVAPGRVPPAPASLLSLLHGIVRRLREQSRRRRDEQELRALPDHELRDLAIGRSDIAACIEQGRDHHRRGPRFSSPRPASIR